ncbi:SDR family NAD(P)-dependent oxidoreductase [Streptomyces radicis]|uniref:SDR family NAD(P)-dependent oxidoreductase n=1 Tax=Streptomyces radicis TaxID=1750517 RepID=A0A3A9VXA4_9ACTN|nr:SDR family NAD(P)-dependent oxidoreductase [Streptomyces radicis]RKN05399.1 SDR family NAD(P)-dependent oxidoreductase [Streptomyces radicis]RKN16907.1 SDR family NAD(P)-dependent oxidoreductase [Streptomyces radicis]
MTVGKRYVITGGTDGIGAALARALARRGDHAVAIGTSREKGERLARETADLPGSVTFLWADLALMSETRRALAALEAHPRVDGLVLCARYFRIRRVVTEEGLEHNFALFYLSRALIGEGLVDALAAGGDAVVVNVAGPGHPTPIAWDDLQSARAYDGVRAMFQAGRLNDLLGVTFAERHGARGIRYVLFHPDTTSTGFTGEYDAATAAHIERQKALAKPASAVVPPLLRLLDTPPDAALSAYHLSTQLPSDDKLFPRAAAGRLAGLTAELLEKSGTAGSR